MRSASPRYGLFLLLISGCSSAGQPAEVVRPKAMTAAEAMGEEPTTGVSCRKVSAYAEPLVVDWKIQERLDLEVAMKQGLAVVVHDCKQLKLLKSCSAKGAYPFVGVTRKEQSIQIANTDDLQATVPIGPAGLSTQLQRGSTIDIGIILVGKRSTPTRSLGLPELSGECGGATHFVRAATVGAFSVGTGTVGSVRAVAELFSATAGGSSASTAKSLNRDGDMTACKGAKTTDASPPDQCQSAVRLELAPIVAEVVAANRDQKETLHDVCPDGTVSQGGTCTATATGPFVCDAKNHQQCEEQCDKGNMESCFRFANYLWGELWAPDGHAPPNAEQRMNAALDKACAANFGPACEEIGRGLDSLEFKDEKAERKLAAVEKACDLGQGDACFDLGRTILKGDLVKKDPARAISVQRRGCFAGSFLACSDWAAGYALGLGVPKDLAKAREVQETACDAKDYLSCHKLGDEDVKSRKYASAVRYYARGCQLNKDTCYLPEGKTTAADDAEAKALLEEACKAGKQSTCYVLGRKNP